MISSVLTLLARCIQEATTEGLQGDLEHLAQAFGLEAPNSKSPCAFCACNSSNIPWSDPKPGAAWRAHCFNAIPHWQWQDSHPECCELFTVPGITNAVLRADLMHCKHLGVDSYLLGSFMSYCCHYKLQGSEEDNMTELFSLIQQTYKDNMGKIMKGPSEKPNLEVQPPPEKQQHLDHFSSLLDICTVDHHGWAKSCLETWCLGDGNVHFALDALQELGTKIKYGSISVAMWKQKPFPMLKGKAKTEGNNKKNRHHTTQKTSEKVHQQILSSELEIRECPGLLWCVNLWFTKSHNDIFEPEEKKIMKRIVNNDEGMCVCVCVPWGSFNFGEHIHQSWQDNFQMQIFFFFCVG